MDHRKIFFGLVSGVTLAQAMKSIIFFYKEKGMTFLLIITHVHTQERHLIWSWDNLWKKVAPI